MRNLYIIFSKTDLKTGKMIRVLTHSEYNHCSICLRDDLHEFYSFSRVYYTNPLISGFVIESPCRYTASELTKLKIVTVPVSDESYARVRDIIGNMREHDEDFVYNFLSLPVYPFGKRFRRDNAFICVEFVGNMLRVAGVKIPLGATIGKTEEALKSYPTWEGRAVDGFQAPVWGDDKYLGHPGKMESAVQMCTRFKRLVVGHS